MARGAEGEGADGDLLRRRPRHGAARAHRGALRHQGAEEDAAQVQGRAGRPRLVTGEQFWYRVTERQVSGTTFC